MARKYDREFKLEAIRLVAEDGAQATEVERRLGLSRVMSRSVLYNAPDVTENSSRV
jgi:transposase-like protein